VSCTAFAGGAAPGLLAVTIFTCPLVVPEEFSPAAVSDPDNTGAVVYPGAPDDPVAFPQRDCAVAAVSENVGVVVPFATVNREVALGALTLVTEPLPPPDDAHVPL
jgi:hypothetical protein